MKKKRGRKRREGGSLDPAHNKKKSKHHTKRIAKLFEKGELSSGQSVPHEVLQSFAARDYVPSVADEGFIPWNSLPRDVLDELEGNKEEIKNFIKSNIIKPDDEIMTRHERAVLREQSFISTPHVNLFSSTHYVVPKCVPYGPMPSLAYFDMMKKKGPMMKMIDSFSICMQKGQGIGTDDPLALLLPHQKEILAGTTVYFDISAYFSRIKIRMERYLGSRLDDFIKDIEDCVGVKRIGTPKPDFKDGNIVPEVIKAPLQEYTKHKEERTEPFHIATTLKLDTNGRYYVTISVICRSTLEIYHHKVEKDLFTGVFTDPVIHSSDITHVFHACTCK